MERSNTKLAKWGTSLAVRIPKGLIEAAKLKLGDQLDIELHDGVIVIQHANSKPTLQELVNGITNQNLHPATDWGNPVGNEVW